MNKEEQENLSIEKSGSTGLVRAGNAIKITNKIISEYEKRLIKEEFPTVKIGNQEWMVKNLDVDCYANGDPIPQVQDDEEWENLETGAWCYYDNDPLKGKIYGKLYNWYAVNDPRGLAPKGWKIPSDEDWTNLTDYLGGEDIAGAKMKSTNGWDQHGNGQDGNGTNESGFSGLPGGYRYKDAFNGIGYLGSWWSSSEDNTYYSWDCYVRSSYDGSNRRDTLFYYAWHRYVRSNYGDVIGQNYNKENGLSVRCLRD